MLKHYQLWASRKYSLKVRVLTTLPAGLILLGAIPYALVLLLLRLAGVLGLPSFYFGWSNLLVDGPFRYSRNPMTFGALAVYFGICVWVGLLCAVLAVALIGELLLVYLRKVEEKELVARFGQAYVDYCVVTPFLIPGVRHGQS